MYATLIVLLLIVAALNLKATYVLAHSFCYDSKQKLFQFVLVWLLPIIGAILVLTILRETPTEKVTTDLSDRGGNGDGHIRLDNYSSEDGGSSD